MPHGYAVLCDPIAVKKEAGGVFPENGRRKQADTKVYVREGEWSDSAMLL